MIKNSDAAARKSAIAEFIVDFGREPDDDDLADIDANIIEEKFFEVYGYTPDAQELQDFSIQTSLKPN